MARRREALGVHVHGLAELGKIPGWLSGAERHFLAKGVSGVAAEIAKRAPGGPSGSIGRRVEWRTVSPTRAIIRVRHPAARALEKGAFITPKGLRRLRINELRKQRRRLKFVVDGKTVFAPFVRIKGTGYARRGLAQRGRVIRSAYQDAFGNLRGGGGGAGP